MINMFKSNLFRKNNFQTIFKKHFALSISFKNKINNFYKNVHPDVLGHNCPDDYRIANEKAMQEFNWYLENLDKGNTSESKTLTFYFVTEDNSKESDSIAFEQISIQLESIKANLSNAAKMSVQHNLSHHVDDSIKKIRIMKSQNHKGKVITEESFAHDSSFEAKDSKNVREFKESKLIDDFYNIATEAYLRTISKSKNMKERKEQLTVKLDRALHSQTDIFGNRRTPDPLAKQIVEGLNTFGEFSYFESHVFPPNLIYFDKKMNQDHIHEFLSRMKIDHLENEERYEQKKELRKITSEICDPNNLIRIYVSDFYSYDHMPGYLTIPYNFEFDDLKKYFHLNKLELFRTKEKYFNENKELYKLLNELKTNFNFKEVSILNLDIHLSEMKSLQKVRQVNLELKVLFKLLNSLSKDYQDIYTKSKLNLNAIRNEVVETNSSIEVYLMYSKVKQREKEIKEMFDSFAKNRIRINF